MTAVVQLIAQSQKEYLKRVNAEPRERRLYVVNYYPCDR